MATPKRKKAQEKLPMELPRIPRGSEYAREFRLRLPPDLSGRIEKEAYDTGKPQNRVIIDMLARVTQADESTSIASSARHLETLLAKYSAQQSSVELSKDLLRAVDEILDAKPHEVQARVEGLRVVRRAMREIERTTVKR
jgi:hypothetical protein